VAQCYVSIVNYLFGLSHFAAVFVIVSYMLCFKKNIHDVKYVFRFSLPLFQKLLSILDVFSKIIPQIYMDNCGFGGLEVACWPLVPKFAGSHPVEAVGFLGRKNPQHAFLQRGSKAVGPMS